MYSNWCLCLFMGEMAKTGQVHIQNTDCVWSIFALFQPLGLKSYCSLKLCSCPEGASASVTRPFSFPLSLIVYHHASYFPFHWLSLWRYHNCTALYHGFDIIIQDPLASQVLETSNHLKVSSIYYTSLRIHRHAGMAKHMPAAYKARLRQSIVNWILRCAECATETLLSLRGRGTRISSTDMITS